MTTIRALPASDRPRERLLAHGAGALSDAELIAIQLGSGMAGKSALNIAQALLSAFGGAGGLAQAEPAELARFGGVGPAKAARLAAAVELARRVTREPDGTILVGSADIAREAARMLHGQRSEQVVVLVADSRLRLRRTETVAAGSATTCPVPVREVLATVLRHDGIAFAVAHNHPGGDPTPSSDDREATQALRDAAQATGLRFLDHVVVAGTDWRSAAA